MQSLKQEENGKGVNYYIYIYLSIYLSQTPSLYLLKSEIEETLKRISTHKGVLGIVIVNSEGMEIR